MNADECAQTRNDLGVYLIGAIEPHERARLESHLASCPGCREKLAALAGMPALLRKVPADEAIRAWINDGGDQAPTPSLETMLSTVARTRRRRRRWAIAAAAALAAGLAAAGLQAFRSGTGAAPTPAAPRWTATATGTSPASGPFPAGALRGFEVTAGGKAQVTVRVR